MSISPFIIYLWGISENLRAACCIGTIVVSVSIGVSCLCVAMGRSMTCVYTKEQAMPEEVSNVITKWIKRLIAPLILMALGSVAIPDKKTIACMIVIPAIANSKVIQEDVPEIYNMAVETLKQQMKMP